MARKSYKSPSKARKQKRKTNKSLVRGAIPDNINKTYLLRRLKYNLTRKEADYILEALDDENFDYVTGQPLPETYNELSETPGYYEENFSKDLEWTMRFLTDYSEEISKFIPLKKSYYNNLLIGNYQKALAIIQKIEAEICVSMWGIEQKILIAELERGFKHNKDVLSEILSEDNSNLTNLLSNATSIRIEKNISPSQFDYIVENYVKQITVNKLKEYVLYKVDFFGRFTYEDFGMIFHMENRFSIIDRYLSYTSVLQLILCQWNISNTISTAIANSVKSLVKTIDDVELRKLAMCFGIIPNIQNDDLEFINIIDCYSSSDYNSVIQLSEKFLEKNPASIHFIYTYVKALLVQDKSPKLFSENNSILDQTINVVLIMLKKDANFDDEVYKNCYKIIHLLNCHPLAIGLFYILNIEIPNNLEFYSEINFHNFYLLSSSHINPALYQVMPINTNAFFEKLSAKHGGSSTANLINNIKKLSEKSEINISEYTLRELKFVALLNIQQGRFTHAISLYDKILSSNKFKDELKISHIYLDIVTEKFRTLIKLELFSSALELAVDSIIQNFKHKDRFFSPDLLDFIMESEDELIQGNICSSILLGYFRENIELYNLYVAYDNFLCLNNCKTPNEYISSLQKPSLRDLDFLKNVCRHDVLHSSPSFNDQEELDLERIEICTYLSSNDSKNPEHDLEVSELLRKVLVRKGIKQVDYSKIYVDVNSLVDSLQKDLKENFNRNIEIASLPPEQIQKIVDSVGNLLVYYIDDNIQVENEANDDFELEKVQLTSYSVYFGNTIHPCMFQTVQ